MTLERIAFDQTNRPLHGLPVSGPLDFDAPYQRGHVWTLEQRRNLIKSLMQALPVGVIFINYRSLRHLPVVVDGKQRLTSILMFLRDEFSVPARWFADEDTEASPHPSLRADAGADLDGEVLFSQLTDTGQARLLRNTIAFYETRLPSVDAERELYHRINFGGTPHQGPAPA